MFDLDTFDFGLVELLDSVSPSTAAIKTRRDIGFPFGSYAGGEPVRFIPDRDGHVLIASAQESDAIVAAQSLLASVFLASGNDVHIIDLAEDCTDFDFFDQYATTTSKTLSDANELLESICVEMKRRNAILAEHNVASIEKYLDDIGDNDGDLDTVFVFVNNLALLTTTDQAVRGGSKNPSTIDEIRSSAIDCLSNIVLRGRSASIHLIMASGDFMTAGSPWSGAMKSGMSRLLLGPSSTEGRWWGLRNHEGSPHVAEGSPIGRGIWEPYSSSSGAEVEVWRASPRRYRLALDWRYGNQIDPTSLLTNPISIEDRTPEGDVS